MSRHTLLGPKPIRYYIDSSWRLQWHKIPDIDVPYPYLHYWSVTYEGEHVADLFQGQSDRYYAIVFDKATIRSTSLKFATLHIAGLVVGLKQ